jgi:acyl-CoA dehydrogenase
VYPGFASAGFLVPNFSPPLPVHLLKAAGITHLPGDLKVEEFDYLHTLIYKDEVGEIDPLYGRDTEVRRWHE